MSQFIAWFYRFKKRHPYLVMSVLVYGLVPVLVGLALGYEMHDDSPVHIPTVVVNGDKSQFSRDFINYVDETAYFDVAFQADNQTEAERLIQEGQAMAGIVIPTDFYKNLLAGRSPDMLLLYDGSQLAVVSVAKLSLSEIMLNMNGAYLQKIFAAKLGVMPAGLMGQVLPVNVNYQNMFNPTKSFRYYLLPGMLLAILQVGIVMLGAERGYESRRLYAADFGRHLQNLVFWSLLATMGMMICLGVQLLVFGLPYRGTVAGGVLLLAVYALTITTMGYLVGSLIPERTFAVQLAAICVLPTSVLAGYTYPLTAMPAAYQSFARLLPYTYLGSDIRALCLKPMAMQHIMPHIIFLAKYALVEILLLLAVKLLLGWLHRTKPSGNQTPEKEAVL